MKIVLAMFCGGLTSAAWIAPRPYYSWLGAIAFVLFLIIRGMQ